MASELQHCLPSLSWDHCLCERCRRLFDIEIVGKTPFEGNHSEEKWWHDVCGLKKCAALHCRLCALVLLEAVDHDENESDENGLAKVGKGGTWLTCEVFLYDTNMFIRILRPEVDPGPESSLPTPNVRNIIPAQIDVRAALGKLSTIS